MIARKGLLTLGGIAWLAVGIGARGQDPAFTVSSIKPNTSGLPYNQSGDPPDGVALVNERLRDVILFAFGLYEFQLTGDPAWVSRDRFDITARADGPLTFDEKRTENDQSWTQATKITKIQPQRTRRTLRQKCPFVVS